MVGDNSLRRDKINNNKTSNNHNNELTIMIITLCQTICSISGGSERPQKGFQALKTIAD